MAKDEFNCTVVKNGKQGSFKDLFGDTLDNIQKIEHNDIEKFVALPVYAKGCCWNRTFDGWTVIYRHESGNLMFDYRGASYSANGFLPSEYTMPCSSTYNNAFYTIKGGANG